MTKKAQMEIKRIIKELTGWLIKDLDILDYASGYVTFLHRDSEGEWEEYGMEFNNDERWMF